MNKIIVATDFSTEAEHALEYAAAAAKDLNTGLLLFNSFSISSHSANSLISPTAFTELTEENNLILKKRAQQIQTKYNITVEYESTILNVVDELENVFDKHNASLIVLGMSKKSFTQDLFGSTTVGLISKLKFPVLTVPLGVKYQPIKKILFACDILRGVHKLVLEKITEIAKPLNAEIEIFHVHKHIENLNVENTKNTIEETLKDVKHYYKNVESESVIQEIGNEAKNINADLVIMVPYRYGFWSSLVHRSKTRVMATNTEVPLLSIPLG